MCQYPEITKIIQYSNGASISISGIEPFSFSTREIENKNIHVIFSLMEEIKKPDFLVSAIDKNLYPWIYHYYYSIGNEDERKIEKVFEPIYTKIKKFLDRRMNILVHCRTGISTSSSIILYFFIKSIVYNPQYLIYDYFNFVPQTHLRWTDSLVDFIRYYYPKIQLKRTLLEKLYIYENNLLFEDSQKYYY